MTPTPFAGVPTPRDHQCRAIAAAKSLSDRLMERVSPEPNSGCWLWMGELDSNGYGRIKVSDRGKRQAAHRVAYEIYIGPIADGLTLDHKCRVRCCINPHHLDPVSNRENVLRGIGPTAMKSRQTHCVHGHEFTPENTKRRPSGGRGCRACETVYQRKKRENVRAALRVKPLRVSLGYAD